MRYKSEAGIILDSINQDFGVANNIFMDNALGQTGYKAETQRVEILERMEV